MYLLPSKVTIIRVYTETSKRKVYLRLYKTRLYFGEKCLWSGFMYILFRAFCYLLKAATYTVKSRPQVKSTIYLLIRRFDPLLVILPEPLDYRSRTLVTNLI